MTNRTELVRAEIERKTDAATAALARGFFSEANRKDALASVTRAFDGLNEALRDELLNTYPHREDGERGEVFEALYWSQPAAHNWNAKAAARFAAYPDYCAKAEALAALRAEIKAAPVEPKPVREDHALLIEVRKNAPTPEELSKLRGEQYSDTLDLGRKLKGLPVSVHRVFCMNYARTTWVRFDWYLRGNRVPFSIIAAAYEQLVREGTIVEEAA